MLQVGVAVGVLCLSFVSCASLSEVDRSHVNRPTMDLRVRQTPPQTPTLSSLGSIQRGTAGGTCSTCAH